MQHKSHGKIVIFEGDVKEVSNWINKNIGNHETISIRDYFKDEVWGVYKNGEENFSYYYQCLGNGRYSIFVIQ